MWHVLSCVCVCVCGVRFHILKSSTHTHTHKTRHAHNSRPTFGLSFCPKNVTGCRFQPFLLLQLYRIVLPPLSLTPFVLKLSLSHTRSLALLRTSLLSFYLCHSCFGTLILTAVDMHIMGIERFLFCFSSLLLAFSHSLPFFFLAAACPLGYRAIGFRLGFRQFSVCSFNSSFSRYFIAFEIASISFHLLHLTLV